MKLKLTSGRRIRLKRGRPVVTLPISQVFQEQEKWCWAACTEMILGFFFQKAPKKCEIANWLLKAVKCCDCCDLPFDRSCNRSCGLFDVCKIFDGYRLKHRLLKSCLFEGALLDELNERRPVLVGLTRAGGGEHLVVLSGWGKTSDGVIYLCNDPDTGPGVVNYMGLMDANGTGAWFVTWANLET
jgi:hypothetical protein